jgi:hypothetical protein
MTSMTQKRNQRRMAVSCRAPVPLEDRVSVLEANRRGDERDFMELAQRIVVLERLVAALTAGQVDHHLPVSP